MSNIIKPPSYVNSMNLGHAMARDAKLRWLINEHQALTLHDSTRHNNTGVLTSVVANGEVDLDGVEDLVTGTRVPVTDWSLAVIYMPDTVSGLHCIYDQGDIYLSQSGADIIYGFADSGGSDITSTAASVLTAGAPVDIMITKYGSVHTIYVDGLQQDTFSDATSPDTSQTNCIVGRRVSPGVSYVALTPANLTAEKGINGKLEYSSLSDSLNSANVCELLSSYTGSIHAWIKPSWASTDTDDHYVCDFGSVKLFWDGSETKWTGTVNSVSVTVTDSFSANTWIYLILTWDSNAPTLDITADATAGAQVTSAHTVAAPAGTLYVGSDSAGANTLSGPESVRIAGIIESSFYNVGDGDVDMYVVDPGAVMFEFSDEDTGVYYWHSGKTVSAIADGANDDTLTTAAGADNSFADGDAVVVSDGVGHSILAYVEGNPTDTTVVVDDGAGADAGEMGKVGVFADLDGDSQYFYRSDDEFPQSGILGDLTIQAWIKPDSVSGNRVIVAKYNPAGNKRMYNFLTSDDELLFSVSSDGTSANSTNRDSTNCNLTIGVWCHLAVSYDASAGDCFFYKNGILLTDNGVPLKTSIADKDPEFTIGVNDNLGDWFDGSVHNIALFDDIRTSAEILASATDPNEDLSGEGNIIGQWMFNEGAAAAAIDNTQGDAGRDLIPYDGGDTNFGSCGRTQEAYVSRNLHHDPGAENGGIGGITVGSNWTVTKDTSEVHADSQSLKLVAAAADDNDECVLTAPVLATGDDYWCSFWIYVSALHGSSDLYLDIDGNANILSRQINTGTDDNGTSYATGTWLYYEQCFEGDQDGSHNFNLRIDGAGAGTNTATVYVDGGRIQEDPVVNPGMEGGATPPASWTQETNATVVSDTSPHSGTNCLKTTAGAVNVGAKQSVTLVDGRYYTAIGWAKATAGDTAEITVDTGDTSTISAGTVTATSWTQTKATFLSTGTSGVIYLRGQANGDIVWFDDIMLTILDDADATSAGGTSDFADGKVHDVSVWSSTLRLEEAKRHSDKPYEVIE